MARYDSPGFNTPLPGVPVFDSGAVSNAQGSNGIGPGAPDVMNGEVIGQPVISDPFGTSQLDSNRPVHPVTAGATSSMSDDIAAHASSIDGTDDAAPYMSTGAGSGHVAGPAHPNSGR